MGLKFREVAPEDENFLKERAALPHEALKTDFVFGGADKKWLLDDNAAHLITLKVTSFC